MRVTSCQFEAAGETYSAEFIGGREGHPGDNWWLCSTLGLRIMGNIGAPPVADLANAAEALINPPEEG